MAGMFNHLLKIQVPLPFSEGHWIPRACPIVGSVFSETCWLTLDKLDIILCFLLILHIATTKTNPSKLQRYTVYYTYYIYIYLCGKTSIQGSKLPSFAFSCDKKTFECCIPISRGKTVEGHEVESMFSFSVRKHHIESGP